MFSSEGAFNTASAFLLAFPVPMPPEMRIKSFVHNARSSSNRKGCQFFEQAEHALRHLARRASRARGLSSTTLKRKRYWGLAANPGPFFMRVNPNAAVFAPHFNEICNWNSGLFYPHQYLLV